MKYKKLLPIVKYDDYIKEWDYEKNKDRNPNTLTAGSSHKVWWKCSVCGHSWQAAPSRRRLVLQRDGSFVMLTKLLSL